MSIAGLTLAGTSLSSPPQYFQTVASFPELAEIGHQLPFSVPVCAEREGNTEWVTGLLPACAEREGNTEWVTGLLPACAEREGNTELVIGHL